MFVTASGKHSLLYQHESPDSLNYIRHRKKQGKGIQQEKVEEAKTLVDTTLMTKEQKQAYFKQLGY